MNRTKDDAEAKRLEQVVKDAGYTVVRCILMDPGGQIAAVVVTPTRSTDVYQIEMTPEALRVGAA